MKITLAKNRRAAGSLFVFFIFLSAFVIFSCDNPFIQKIVDPKTVTFESNGGSNVENQTVFKGQQVKRPSDPSRSGYTFAAWYSDNETFLEEWDFDAVPIGDVTLYAKWQKNALTYTVSFDSGGGSAVSAISNVAHGSTITKPDDPTRTGFDFGGWYKEASAINEWDFASDAVTSDITLYAKWNTIPGVVYYIVTFDKNGGDTEANPPTRIVASGENVTAPQTPPARTGYNFIGWYKEPAATNEWDFADAVTSDITLYAKWEKAPNSPDNPFLVRNATELGYVGRGTANPTDYEDWTLSAHYLQTANITLSSGTDWTPIGGLNSNNFIGTYNGGGHTISGLTINANSTHQGMFGYIGTNGKVEKLGLINVNINSTNYYVGGIAGYNNGTIQNCYVSASVTGTYYVGGITGGNSGTIQNCYVIGSVTATGTNSSQNQNGGISGYNGPNSPIRNCVALNQSVTNEMNTTNIGRVGYSATSTAGSRQNNYGWKGMTLTVAGSPQTPTSSLTGKDGLDITAAEVKTEAWWTNPIAWNSGGIGVWDFTSADSPWVWDSALSRPVLRNETAPQAWPAYLTSYTVTFNSNGGDTEANPTTLIAENGSLITAPTPPTKTANYFIGWYREEAATNAWDFASDTVTSDITLYAKWGTNPFLVSNEIELRYVGRGNANPEPYKYWTLSAHYKQTDNITLTQGNWTPIGTGTSSNSFTGTYNGGGYTITGLTINSTSQYNGMFSYIRTGGKVENLGLINVNINSTGGQTGGIAGGNERGTIQNCYVSGSVTGTNSVGGIAGSGNGTIQNCYVIGSVSGTYDVGGIEGFNNGTIQNCYVIGSVTGTTGGSTSTGNGGIAGSGGASTIRNCVALHESVTSGTVNIRRVMGSGTRQNNYAWSGMTLTKDGTQQTPVSDLIGADGADITAAQAKTESWWTTAGNWSTAGIGAWNFTTVWQWNEGGMPSLRGVGTVPQVWPGYLVDPFNVATDTEWAAAVTAIRDGSLTSYTINVTNDFSINGYSSNTFTRTGITVAINGVNTITLTGQGSLLYIGNNQTVTMSGLTLKGFAYNERALVCIYDGTFNMESGMITDNINIKPDYSHGGGVYVRGGTFTMNGGTISGNEANIDMDYKGGGGGVFVDTGGTFNMLKGEISGNKAIGVNGGGVYVGSSGIFRISNGTVYGTNGGANSNTVTGGTGAALYKDSNGTAQYGTGGTWFNLNTTETTILVENGGAG